MVTGFRFVSARLAGLRQSDATEDMVSEAVNDHLRVLDRSRPLAVESAGFTRSSHGSPAAWTFHKDPRRGLGDRVVHSTAKARKKSEMLEPHDVPGFLLVFIRASMEMFRGVVDYIEALTARELLQRTQFNAPICVDFDHKGR